jgi:hypothetical protein
MYTAYRRSFIASSSRIANEDAVRAVTVRWFVPLGGTADPSTRTEVLAQDDNFDNGSRSTIRPLRANRGSFDSGGQQQPACAQDDNS